MKITEDEKYQAHLLLRKILEHDMDIFLDNTMLKGYISDFFRGEPRIRRILKEAVNDGLANKVYSLQSCDEADCQIRLDMLRNSFREDHFFTESVSNYVIDCFAFAAGLTEELEEFTEESVAPTLQFKELVFRQYSDGDYLGELNEEDNRSGFGLFEREDGVKYAGERRVDRYSGCGIFFDPANRERYAGEWRLNKPTGIGVRLYKNGIKCAGEWKNGRMQGYGISYLPNGSCMIGHFTNGHIKGYGILAFDSGDYIMGAFCDGKLNGVCQHYFSSGRVIEEIWENGIKK